MEGKTGAPLQMRIYRYLTTDDRDEKRRLRKVFRREIAQNETYCGKYGTLSWTGIKNPRLRVEPNKKALETDPWNFAKQHKRRK